MFRTLVGLSLLWAQIESPKGFVGGLIGAAAPIGPMQGSTRTYPTHGYAQPGFCFGLQGQIFLMPYLSLSASVSQRFLSLNADELEENFRLFPQETDIDENPRISHTAFGLGIGTGVKVDWVSLYVPLQIAIGLYAAPEIEGRRGPAEWWTQSRFSTLQAGVLTGFIANFEVSEKVSVGVALLFGSLRSGEQEFRRERYNRGTIDRIYSYRSGVPTDLAEAGLVLGVFL